MKTNFNKKKFVLLPSIKNTKYLIFTLFFLFILFLIYDELITKKRYKELLQEFSENYNYQLEFYEINNINRVEKKAISKIINNYIGQSIFLIPLNDISKEIQNLKWVKGVNLSTDLNNKIEIEIIEYEPVGLYFFNDQTFYFSKEGKIIDMRNDDLNERYIIFSGKNSLNNAPKLLQIINKMQYPELKNIKEAHYIKERRWNLKLNNQIIVFLSEKNIETSLINYIKLLRG